MLPEAQRGLVCLLFCELIFVSTDVQADSVMVFIANFVVNFVC